MFVDFSKLRFAVFFDGDFEAAFMYLPDAIDFADMFQGFKKHCIVCHVSKPKVYYRDWEDVDDA